VQERENSGNTIFSPGALRLSDKPDDMRSMKGKSRGKQISRIVAESGKLPFFWLQEFREGLKNHPRLIMTVLRVSVLWYLGGSTSFVGNEPLESLMEELEQSSMDEFCKAKEGSVTIESVLDKNIQSMLESNSLTDLSGKQRLFVYRKRKNLELNIPARCVRP
jgi:hypothetical protein